MNVSITARDDDFRYCWCDPPPRIGTKDLVPCLEGKLGDGLFIYDPWRMDGKEATARPIEKTPWTRQR